MYNLLLLDGFKWRSTDAVLGWKWGVKESFLPVNHGSCPFPPVFLFPIGATGSSSIR